MILIIGHSSVIDIRFHAIQHRRQFEIAFFTRYCILVVKVLLDTLIFQEKTKYFICCFLILAVCHHTELKVDTGVQHIVLFPVIDREYKRIDIHIRVYRFDLRNRIASDGVHR